MAAATPSATSTPVGRCANAAIAAIMRVRAPTAPTMMAKRTKRAHGTTITPRNFVPRKNILFMEVKQRSEGGHPAMLSRCCDRDGDREGSPAPHLGGFS